MLQCHCSKRFLTSAASVLAGVGLLFLGGTIAHSQEAPAPGVGGGTILVQRTDHTGRKIGTPKSQQKDPMSWKDILNKGQQFPPGAPQLSQEQQSVSSYASVQQWKAQIVSLLERNKQYPVGAQSKGEQGVVQVFFSLDRLGQVIASRIVRSSGSLALDAEVQALLWRAQPFPEPPEELAGNQVDLTVPIRFSLPEHTAQQSAPGAPQPGSQPNSPESVGQRHGPSFDCKSTKNPNEKLICQSTELSELDNRMVVFFEAVMNSLNTGDRQQLRSDQREWLKDRLDCAHRTIATSCSD
jgi:TonB family protein